MVTRANEWGRWMAAAALAASACLPSEGTCEGGGTRVDGVCECPEGTAESGSRCLEVRHHGAEADAGSIPFDAGSSEDVETGAATRDGAEPAGTETDSETPQPEPAPEDAGSGAIDAGSERDAMSTDSSTPAGLRDASVAPDSSPPDAITPWRPPAVSQVRGTGGACLAVSPPAGGRCGGYYCGVSEAVLAPEIDPDKPCGAHATAACQGTLTRIASQCAGKAEPANVVALALGDTSGFKRDVEACVAADAEIVAGAIPAACQACFTSARFCCVGSDECRAACLGDPASQACDNAMRAAGCVNPSFTCAGLPTPF